MLSLILPTYNEAENLPGLLEEIEGVLHDIPFEVIVVDDDSPDRTWEVTERLMRDRPYLRVLRRVHRRGLFSAVLEGLCLAHGDVLAVMDSDGQHDPQLLPRLYVAVRSKGGLAIGSRYVPGGSVEGWARARHFLSFLATGLAWLVTPVRVADPMSGFFAVKRDVLIPILPRIRPRGFKILLEILALLPRTVRVKEVPLVFRVRRHGYSKLSAGIESQFLVQIFSLVWRRQGPLLLFFCLLLALSLFLVPRAWSLRLLYTDTHVREEVRSGMSFLSNDKGWLQSDMLLSEVETTRMRFLFREHRRGDDTEQCYVFRFSDHALLPCDTSA